MRNEQIIRSEDEIAREYWKYILAAEEKQRYEEMVAMLNDMNSYLKEWEENYDEERKHDITTA